MALSLWHISYLRSSIHLYRLAVTNCYLTNQRKNSTHKPSTEAQRVVFSGIQPTGIPHIGNYYGAIKGWVSTQNTHGDVILSVVDLHSLTVPQQPQQLRRNIREMFACLLACGIDTEETVLFQQSAISEHAELAWILGCFTTLPRLQHLPQWKQKSETMKEVPLGLFTYPVLQAADILLYKATDVPVGEDQVKHIELARHLAKLFNNQYGFTFPKPKPHIGDFHRIKSLRSPGTKMSKSELDPRSRIELTDSPDTIADKVRKAVTDVNPSMTYDPSERPGVSNLVDIHAAFMGLTPEEICEQCAKLDTLQYKRLVADIVIEGLAAIRERFRYLMNSPEHIETVIRTGNMKAQEIAHKNFHEVKSKIGIL